MRDIRHAFRALRRERGHPFAAVATLSLAIGSNIAMFAVLNAVLFEPLPYRAPDRLAMLWTEDLTQDFRGGRSALEDVEQWRGETRTFEDLATFDAVSMTLTAADGAEQIIGASVSPNLLALLGVQPVRGRGFSADEAQQPLALISQRFWQKRFGGGADAVGATLVVNGAPLEIIGILPPGVEVATVDADVWIRNPMAATGEVGEGQRAGATWFVVGRLQSAATLDEARSEMRDIAARLNDQLPVADRNRSVAVMPLDEYVVGAESRLALWLLGGAVCLVFLIAAANVASLSLVRSIARAREMALRTALGASASRIARQLLTESVLVAVFSGLVGAGLAAGAVRLLLVFGPQDLPRLNELSFDAHAVAWGLGLSLVAGILVGLAPAVTTLRRAPARAGAERGVTGTKSMSRARRVIVVAEFALAIVLLVTAGLLVRSWDEVSRVDPGFRPERVLSMRIAVPPGPDEPAQRAGLYDRVLAELRAIPGVDEVGMVGDLWIANDSERLLTFERDNGTASESLRLRRDEASADFFQAIGTPMRQGRPFSIVDHPEATRVAIVNEAMAQQAWPGQDPIGRRFKFGPATSANPWFTTIGVVANMRRQGLERDAVPQVFESLAQNPPRSVEVFVRTSSDDPVAMIAPLRAAVRRVERNAPIYAVAPLTEQLGRYLEQRRFQTSLLTAFSITALLLAAVGIYGLIQYSIATRTQEIGLRMALGARAVDIVRLVLGEGMTLCLAGIAIGFVAAWWAGHTISSLLFGITSSDPWTFALVALLLTGVASAACYLPARRAARLDPVVALRTT